MSHAKTRLAQIKVAGYGRTAYPPPPVVSAEVRDAPRCAKCRNLTTADGLPACGKGLAIGTAQVCASFNDASRQRDFFANFTYEGRFRR